MKILDENTVYLEEGETMPWCCENCGYIQSPYAAVDQDGRPGMICAFCDMFSGLDELTRWQLV